MRSFAHHVALVGLLVGLGPLLSCMPPPASQGDIGVVGLKLQVAPGVTINAINWSIANGATSFSQAGLVNEQFSNTIAFQVGGLPSGSGYAITLNATSADGSLTCTGSASFSVAAGTTTGVSLTLTCSAGAGTAGTVVVNGTTVVCANITSLSVSPLETTVNNPIALSATASAGPVAPTFAWSATAGTFDNAASATPVFTCPATPGPVTITLDVSPGGPGCTSTTSQSVAVTCDTLTPTFTNVYANVLGVRCTGCHRPGGSGVTVGALDLSTQARAYTNLVGVPGAGVGAGSSGITCASLSPAMPRVNPSDAAGSLLFNKVNAKVAGVLAACGSPMPLPGSAAALTAAQVALIGAWIDAGAHSD